MTVDETTVDGFEYISIQIESGASGNALPKFQCTDLFLRRTKKSRSGYKYEPAGGHSIVGAGLHIYDAKITLM